MILIDPVEAARLTEFPGLTDRHRAIIRAAVADVAGHELQIRRGGGWDNSTFVAAVNEICGLHLTPVTMTP